MTLRRFLISLIPISLAPITTQKLCETYRFKALYADACNVAMNQLTQTKVQLIIRGVWWSQLVRVGSMDFLEATHSHRAPRRRLRSQ